MEKRNLSKKGLLKAFLLLSTLFILLNFSCKEKGAKEKETNKDSTTNAEDTNQQQAFLAGTAKYAVLQLNAADLVTLFSDPQARKLLIEFTDSNNTGSKTINAVAYAAKMNNNIVGNRQFIFPASFSGGAKNEWDTTGTQILGNNELTLKTIQSALGINGPINAGNAKTLYFYPLKDSDDHIKYKISTNLYEFKKTNITIMITYPPGNNYTNPSPPAPPCDSGTTCGS